MLISQKDSLRELIQELEKELGSDAPILTDLRQQLASMEEAQSKGTLHPSEDRYIVGMRSFPSKQK